MRARDRGKAALGQPRWPTTRRAVTYKLAGGGGRAREPETSTEVLGGSMGFGRAQMGCGAPLHRPAIVAPMRTSAAGASQMTVRARSTDMRDEGPWRPRRYHQASLVRYGAITVPSASAAVAPCSPGANLPCGFEQDERRLRRRRSLLARHWVTHRATLASSCWCRSPIHRALRRPRWAG